MDEQIMLGLHGYWFIRNIANPNPSLRTIWLPSVRRIRVVCDMVTSLKYIIPSYETLDMVNQLTTSSTSTVHGAGEVDNDDRS